MNKSQEYMEYIQHEIKATQKDLQKDGPSVEWFQEILDPLKDIMHWNAHGICLGARSGVEVQVLRDWRYRAIGIDLVEKLPLVLMGDFHNIPFQDDTFDFAFSNSTGHTYSTGKFLSEISRVLKPDAYILFYIRTHFRQDHARPIEELIVEHADQMTRSLFCHGFDIVDHKILSPPIHGGRSRSILMRRKP